MVLGDEPRSVSSRMKRARKVVMTTTITSTGSAINQKTANHSPRSGLVQHIFD
jgi:hypothetical protein